MSTKLTYEARYDNAAYRPSKFEGGNKGYYPAGPADGFGYHSGYLWPWTRFETQEQAEVVVKCMNVAFDEGYRRAKEEIRAALGIAP